MAIRPGTAYPGQTISGDPAYPYGKARNETVPNAFDGTPWEEQDANDLFGFQQSLLARVDADPSDVPDSVTASQYADAIEEIIARKLRQFAIANHVARSPGGSFSSLFAGVVGFPTDVVGAQQLVAFGVSGEIQTSDDGVVWTKRSPGSGSTENLTAGLVGGTSAVVLGGQNGEIQTSTSGTTWTKRTPGSGYTGSFNGGAARSDAVQPRYLLVGSGGEIQTSSDVITWTRRTPDASYAGIFGAAAWSPTLGMWVIAGENGEIQTSTNGTAWTHRTAAGGYTGIFTGAAASDKRFVLVGEDGEIQTSEDGVTWTQRVSGTTNFIREVHYGRSFVAVGESGTILESLDGKTWKNLSRSVFTTNLRGVVASTMDGCGLLVGDNGTIRQALIHMPL